MSDVKMGVFKNDEPLMIESYPNGGWVITQRGESPGVMPNPIGAYSSAKDMLDALNHVLVEDNPND